MQMSSNIANLPAYCTALHASLTEGAHRQTLACFDCAHHSQVPAAVSSRESVLGYIVQDFCS